MRRLLVFSLFLVGCGCQGYVPVEPNNPTPTPVNPGPVDPGPVTPGPVGEGSITDAGYAAVPEGSTEEALYAALGNPFRRSETGGYIVLVYAFRNSDSVAWFFLKDGKVERKSRL